MKVAIVRILGAALLASAIAAAPASAELKRPLVYQLGTGGTPATSFQTTDRLAFDQARKRLYAIDRTNSVATRRAHAFEFQGPGVFAPLAGNYPRALEPLGTDPDIAVNGVTGDVYYVSESTDSVHAFDPTGAALPGFPVSLPGTHNLCGVAIDPAGNIWAADNAAEQRQIVKFDPGGTALPLEAVPVSGIGTGSFCHLDFGSTGDMYVAELNGRVFKLSATGGYASATVLDGESGATDVAVDRSRHRVFVSHPGELKEFEPDGDLFRRFGGFDDVHGTIGVPSFTGLAVDEATDTLFASNNQNPKRVLVFGPRRVLPEPTTGASIGSTRTSLTVGGEVDPVGGAAVSGCLVQYGTNASLTADPGTAPCTPDASGSPYSVPTDVEATLASLVPGTTYHYRVVATSPNGSSVGEVRTATTRPAVKGTTTEAATGVTLSGATLNGSFDPDGLETRYQFEWGLSDAYGKEAPAVLTSAGSTPGSTVMSAGLANLKPGLTYHYRVVAENTEFGRTVGADRTFVTSDDPVISGTAPDQVGLVSATLRADVNPNGLPTVYRFEYGTEDCSSSPCQSSPESTVPAGLSPETVSFGLRGLDPDNTYHFRLVASNGHGETVGPDRTLTTYAADPATDPCPNSHVREQTEASLLLDCRAYELVSAGDAGGYDVTSDLVPGQEPLVSSPTAKDRLLYSIHSGAVPGVAGNPTNFGRDPYLAGRGPGGWSTRYVGLPANGMEQEGAFGSPLLEADPALDRFAFGGTGICDPCFADGSTNLPLRGADGLLVKGIAGSLEAPANPSGEVRRRFSADGTHLIFGTATKLEPTGLDGETTIYDRDLTTGVTQVVSTLPSGEAMGGGNAHQLAVSADGSRVLVAQVDGADAKGNDLYRLFLHIGTDPHSVDLTPTATEGVRFAGMSGDGTRVFLTTGERLLPGDTDVSTDAYLARVDSGGSPSLSLVSVGQGGPSNDDSCEPPGIPDSWNAPEGEGKCSALAFAGDVGTAADGSFYFMSPELLGGPGEGESGQANVYVFGPGAAAPAFVATIDSSSGKPGPQNVLGLHGTIGGLSKPGPHSRFGAELLTVAVDDSEGSSAGDLYVGDGPEHVIRKYNPERNPITSWGENGVLDGTNAPAEFGIGGNGGVWKLRVDGQLSGGLAPAITAGELQARLIADLPNVGPGDVTVTGGPGGAAGGGCSEDGSSRFQVTFTGAFAGKPPALEIDGTEMTCNGSPFFWAGTLSQKYATRPVVTGAFIGREHESPTRKRYFESIAVDGDGRLAAFTELNSTPGEGSGRGLGLAFVNEIYRGYTFADDGSFLGVENYEALDFRNTAFDPLNRFFSIHNELSGSNALMRVHRAPFSFGAMMPSSAHIVGLAPDLPNNQIWAVNVAGEVLRSAFNEAGEVILAAGGTCQPNNVGGNPPCPPTETFASGMSGATALAVDPDSGHVYVDRGNRITELDELGQPVGDIGAGGLLTDSRSVAYSPVTGHLYATTAVGTSEGAVRDFGPVPVSWSPIDNPAVRRAIEDPNTRHNSDFQTSENGRFASFASVGDLTPEADSRGHYELYRYDAGADRLDCASCAPTGAAAGTDEVLTPYGRNLTEDGRVFFTSTDSYVSRDANGRSDAYEWNEGRHELVSTGAGGEASGFLTASADGTDAFFFTRQTLVPEDENGGTIKVYTAREGGGFAHEPPPFPCAASDECHGPGTQEAPPPQISSVTGTGVAPVPAREVQRRAKRCRKGFVKRKGRCVKRNKSRGKKKGKGKRGKGKRGKGKRRAHKRRHSSHRRRR